MHNMRTQLGLNKLRRVRESRPGQFTSLNLRKLTVFVVRTAPRDNGRTETPPVTNTQLGLLHKFQAGSAVKVKLCERANDELLR